MRFPIIHLHKEKTCEKVEKTGVSICIDNDGFVFVKKGNKILTPLTKSSSEIISKDVEEIQKLFKQHNIGGVIIDRGNKKAPILFYPFGVLSYETATGNLLSPILISIKTGENFLKKYIFSFFGSKYQPIVLYIVLKNPIKTLESFSSFLEKKSREIKEVWKKLQSDNLLPETIRYILKRKKDLFFVADVFSLLIPRDVVSDIEKFLFYFEPKKRKLLTRKQRKIASVYNLSKSEIAFQFDDYSWCSFCYTPLGIILTFFSIITDYVLPANIFLLAEKRDVLIRRGAKELMLPFSRRKSNIFYKTNIFLRKMQMRISNKTIGKIYIAINNEFPINLSYAKIEESRNKKNPSLLIRNIKPMIEDIEKLIRNFILHIDNLYKIRRKKTL